MKRSVQRLTSVQTSATAAAAAAYIIKPRIYILPIFAVVCISAFIFWSLCCCLAGK